MIAGIITGIVVLFFIIIYNGVISKKNEVTNSWGGLDACLKQRYDLIPGLVSLVKNYMHHESAVLEKIVELRTRAISPGTKEQEKPELDKQVSKQLSNILVSVEQYPDLKANSNFQDLQKVLYDLELTIAAARRAYNSSVTEYNNSLEMFPSNLVTKLMGLKKKEVFSIPEEERKNPSVTDLLKR